MQKQPTMSSTPSDQTPEINEDQVLDILNGVGENPAPTANPPVPDYAIIGATRPRVPWNGAMETVQPRVPRRPLLAQDVAGPEPLRQPPNLYDPMGEVTRYARDRERLRQGAFIPPRQSDPDPTEPELQARPVLPVTDQDAADALERRRLEEAARTQAESISRNERLLRERVELRDRQRRFAAPYGRTTENNADRAIGERAIEEAARLLQEQTLRDLAAGMLREHNVEAIRSIHSFARELHNAGYVTLLRSEMSWRSVRQTLMEHDHCAYTISFGEQKRMVIRPRSARSAIQDSVTYDTYYEFELFERTSSASIAGTRRSVRDMLREIATQFVINGLHDRNTVSDAMDVINADAQLSLTDLPTNQPTSPDVVPDNFRAITLR